MNDELWITREIVSDLVNALRMTPAIQGGERQDYRRPAGAERVAVAIPGSARATSEHAEVSRYKAGAGKFGLTARQVEVVNAIVDGQSNRDIANTYGITECTVKHHLTRIFDKVGVDSRLELAIFAMNHDLNSPLEQPESGHNTSAEHTLVAADRQINSGKPLQDTGSYAYGDVSNTTKNRHR
jgi:DNA-binding CsgD family transcriptional regulator